MNLVLVFMEAGDSGVIILQEGTGLNQSIQI